MKGWSISLILALLLVSCDKKVVLDELYSFDNLTWHMDSAIVVNWQPNESEETVFMSMYIRHTTDYPYNNIYLFRSIESTQGIEYTDTVDVELANSLGIWNGSGMSNLKTIEFSIGKGAARFYNDERYTLKIIQGMRDTLLYGIQNVGVQFEQMQVE